MSKLQYVEKIIKGALLVFISMLFGKLFSYFYIVLVATKLGSNVYGILSLGLAILSFLTVFSLLGLDEGIIRYISFFKGKNDLNSLKGTILTSIKIVLNSSLLLSILLIISSAYLSENIFNKYDLTKVLLFMAIALPFTSIAQLFLVSFRAFQKPQFEILIKEIFEKSFRLILTFILIFLGFKLTGALIGFVTAIILMFLIAIIVFNKKIFNLFDSKITSRENKRELLNYSIPLMLKNFMWSIIAWTDLLMIGYFKSSSDVGVYNVALPTANLIIVPTYGMMFLFLPIISELYSQNKLSEISEVYKKISKYTLIIFNIPIFLIIFSLSKEIINLFFGQEYANASYPLIILSLGYLIYSLSDISTNILSVIKKTKTIFLIIFFFALTNVILNYFLIPLFGIIGAAIATSLSFAIGGITIMIVSHHYSKLHPFMFKYQKIIIVSLITLIASLITKRIIMLNPLRTIIFAGAILIVFYLLIFLFKVFKKEELDLLKEIKTKLLGLKKSV